MAIFLAALWLSSVLELRSVNYLLSHMVSVGVLALMILFQPELRQILEQIGSKNIRLLRVFAPEQQVSRWSRPSTRRSWPAPKCPNPGQAC